MCNHPDTELRKPDGTMERYDDDLLPLMPLLWERGLVDRFDCQGDAFFIDQTQYENRQHRAYIMFELNDAALQLASDLLARYPGFREEKVLFSIAIDRASTPRWQRKDDVNHATRITLRFPNQEIVRLIEWLTAEKHRETLSDMLEEITRSTGDEQQAMINELIEKEGHN